MQFRSALDGALSYVTIFNVVLLVLASVVAWFARSYYRFWSLYEKGPRVPGPPVAYPLGAASVFIKHGQHKGWKKILEMGDTKVGMSRAYTPGLDLLMVTHKEHLRQILQVSPHHFYPGRSFGNPAKNWEAFKLGGESVLFTDADDHKEWLHLRRVLGRAFMTTAVKPLVYPIAKVLDTCVDVIRSESNRVGSGNALDFVPICNALTFDILGACSFSATFGALESIQNEETMNPILEAYSTFHKQSLWRRAHHFHPFYNPEYLWIPTRNNREMARASKTLFAEVDKQIEFQKKCVASSKSSATTDETDSHTKEYRSFIDILAEASDDGKLTTQQLRSNALTILSAGHETTGMNLIHTFYLLAQHPDAQTRICDEVNTVWPEGTEPDEETSRKLEFTRNVLKEALRLYPQPFHTVRSIPQAMNVGGYDLPKNTVIMIDTALAMRDPHNWEDPDLFNPDRFDTELVSDDFYAFMPFMHGGRSCIGRRFAELTTSLAIAALVRNFEFSVADGYEYDTVSQSSFWTLVNGMQLVARERRKS